MPRTRNISACFVSIETINVTIRHPLLVDTSLCSYRSLLNLVVRSPAEHRSWCPGSRVPIPSPAPPQPVHTILQPWSLMAGVKPQQREHFYSGWILECRCVAAASCGFPAPGSGYSYLGSVVESTVDISIINISTQRMNLLQWHTPNNSPSSPSHNI